MFGEDETIHLGLYDFSKQTHYNGALHLSTGKVDSITATVLAISSLKNFLYKSEYDRDN